MWVSPRASNAAKDATWVRPMCVLLTYCYPAPHAVGVLTSFALSFSCSPVSALWAARSLPARSTKLMAAVVTAMGDRNFAPAAAAWCGCMSCVLLASAIVTAAVINSVNTHATGKALSWLAAYRHF